MSEILLRRPSDSNKNIASKDSFRRSLDLDSIGSQFIKKLCLAEAILARMFEEGSVEPPIQCLPRHFFKEQCPGGFEYTTNLSNRVLPQRHMMQHAEVKHGVEVLVGEWQVLGVRYSQPDTCIDAISQAAPRALYLSKVQVYGADLRNSKLFQQDSHAVPAAATNLQYARAIQASAQSSQQRTFVEALHKASDRIVDQNRFGQIQFHESRLRSRNQRTKGVTEPSRSTDSPASCATLCHSRRE